MSIVNELLSKKEKLFDSLIFYPQLNIDSIRLQDKVYFKHLLISEIDRNKLIKETKEKQNIFNYKDDNNNSSIHNNFIFEIIKIYISKQSVNIKCNYNNEIYIIPLIDDINKRKLIWEKSNISEEVSTIIIYNVPIIDILKIP